VRADLTHAVRIRTAYEEWRQQWTDLGAHLPRLYDFTTAYAEPIVIELGVRDGVSTMAFLRGVSEVGGHVHSADTRHPQVPIWLADTGLWTFHVGDDLSVPILDALPERADIVFIDTSHYYDHTLAELRTYVPRVKRGGLVLCHDTELEVPPDWPGIHYPVRNALDHFCAETGRTWVNIPGDSGLGVIRIPN
jgi:cephalosporin hydroxylase